MFFQKEKDLVMAFQEIAFISGRPFGAGFISYTYAMKFF